MSELIEKIEFELKEKQHITYFEKIDNNILNDIFKHIIVIEDQNVGTKHIFKIVFNDNKEYIIYFPNNNLRFYYHKIIDDNIIDDNSIVNIKFYDKILVLINRKFIKCFNLLTRELTLDIDFKDEDLDSSCNKFILNNNILYQKKGRNINNRCVRYTYIFNIDTWKLECITDTSIYYRGDSNHSFVSSKYINNNISNINSYSSRDTKKQIYSLKKNSIDNRFIFLDYSKQYIYLYDVLKNKKLKDSIMNRAYYIKYINNFTYIYVTHEQFYYYINFRKYIDKIYENERIEAEKALNPPKIEEKSVETIQPIVEKDVKSSSRNSYSIEITNVSDNNETNVVEATVVEEFSDLHPIHKVDYSDDRWMRKNEWKRCTLCYKNFGLFVRKNHCRSCGRLACSACSNFIGKGKIIAGMPISVQNKIKAHKDVKLCIRCHSHEMKDN